MRRQVPSDPVDTLCDPMRLLHTADWHLGRAFHGARLLDDQARWVDWLVELARAERPDAVLVAGDLYDRALPPVDAVALADEALTRLTEVAPVVAIPGNHDSAARLSFNARLAERAGLHLRTDPARIGEPVLLGPLAVYAIPYLEPDGVREALGVGTRGHAAVLEAAMARVRADLATRPAGTQAVVVAHALVTGGDVCSSERDLSVGGVADVAAAVFAGIDYLALGHLHGPQRVGERGRYAGSPLAFSFSEARHAKSVALVELGSEPELVACPVPRALVRVRGTLAALLQDPAHELAEDAWVEVTLTDAVRPEDAMDRLRTRFPHAVALHFAPEGARAAVGEGGYAARLHGLSDLELAVSFVQDVRGTDAEPGERGLLADALGAARVSEAVRT